MKFCTVFIFCLLLSASVFADETGATDLYPVTHHVTEAMTLNKERVKLYRQHFGKDAAKVFKKLILKEYQMVPLSYVFDLSARKFIKNGVGIFVEDLSPISSTPEFSSERVEILKSEVPVPLKNVKLDISVLKQTFKLDQFSNREDFVFTLGFLHKRLEELKSSPHANCLYRHFLESMAVILKNAPRHHNKALELGMESTLPLSRKLAKSHLIALLQMAKLDHKAFPFQEKGIPLFCQDLPPIKY